ncbi:MAG: MarR family transcriptional regulator [Gammaproteobacteria bacterium]|nr:MarR family transcriptional regulator [Gammaproteobacteria bacterium]
MLELKNLPDRDILKKFAARYPDADVERVLHFLNLLRVASDLSSGLDRLLARHKLLQGRWWVLVLLMREDDYCATPSRLAEQAGVSRATMTGLIDGLQREELVKRVPDPDDRRKTLIRLTATGQARLDQVMPDYYQRLNRLMSVLTDDQGQALMEILALIKKQKHVFDRL